MIGRAMNGRYELVEILGVGGMATVYRGHDRVLGRPVAVKVLNGGLADDPRFAERFSREAQHAAMLVHPRIVTVFDSGVDQGSPYIVMELVHGRPLSALIAEQPGFPIERAAGIAAAVCEALEVAHGAGLVHRDIKPGNIMITNDGGVKVVDFGIARASSSGGQQLTQTATVLGTASYLSPEQATARPLDGRADLYAVGCVLYEMLAGEPPFTAETPVAIAYLHVSEQPVPVSLRRPDVPSALDAAILRLLAKDPAARPADAAAARAELLAAVPAVSGRDRTEELLAAPLAAPTQALPPFQQHTSVLPPVAPYAAEPEPVKRRNPLVLVGIAAVVLVAAIGVGAFVLNGSSGNTPRTGTAAAPAITTNAPTSAAPSAPTTAPAKNPAAAVQALRAAIAQAQFNKQQGKQNDLLGLLDDAAQAISDGQPGEADQPLRDAQRLLRDLAKKHAIDNAQADAWAKNIGGVLNNLRAQAPQQPQTEEN